MLFEFEPLPEIGKNDAGITWRSPIPRMGEGILAMRKKGAIFGGHYHLGKSDTKNPEILLLVSGSMIGTFFKLDSPNEKEVVEFSQVGLLKVPPQVVHSFEALSDVYFLEFNSLEEHAADTLRFEG